MAVRTILIVLFGVLLADHAWCDGVSRASKAASSKPFPAIVTAAQSNSIPIQGIDPLGEPGDLAVGDSFTALITHFEKGVPHRQWLLYLQASEPDSTTKANTNPPKPLVLYTSSGSRLEFLPEAAPVALRTIGPYGAPGTKPLKSGDQTVRFTLNKGFLALGLDRTAASTLKTRRLTTNMPFLVRPVKFTDAQIVEGRKTVAARGITPADERAMAGAIPALMSYFSVVQETKGLEEIMLKVIETPSLWSLIKNRGVRVGIGVDSKRFAAIDPEPWEIPTRPPAYDFAVDLSLNNHLAANVTFVVTTPRPPLLTCGGIAGFIVENPTDPGNFLTLRIISARKHLGKEPSITPN